MEAGSLLQEALSRQAEQHDVHNNFGEHALYIDIYILNNNSNDSAAKIQQLLQLTRIAQTVNAFFQAQKNKSNNYRYDWHMGGDGPVFGIHATDGIPHLRAICRYGANVADEWMAIHLMVLYTQQEQQEQHLAVECWDVQDGQILLIESAEVLPEWVDRMGPEACRHRCWIRQGKIQLIAPPPSSSMSGDNNNNTLDLGAALDILSNNETTTSDNKSLVVTPEPVQTTIQDCIQRYIPHVNNNTTANTKHKAAIAVPRTVAFLIQQRPDLVNAAIVAFANQALDPLLLTTSGGTTSNNTTASRNKPKRQSTISSIECEDWVWTTHDFSRTNYAMLRTIVSPTWKTEAFVPKDYQSVELRRVQRQCAVEATPHLRHAVQLGVRLVAGLNALLMQQQRQQSVSSISSQSSSMSLHERRILHYWPRLLQGECALSAQWLLEAWQAGPNRATYNLEPLLECPVVTEELESQPDNLTPLTHPEVWLAEQIKKELRKSESQQTNFVMPRQDEVDSGEDWIVLAPDTVEEQMQAMRGERRTENGQSSKHESSKDEEQQRQKVKQLDSMLGSFENFMVERSGAEGITNVDSKDKSKLADTDALIGDKTALQISPRLFLHLLKATLDPSTSPETILSNNGTSTDGDDDQFFSKEDYEAMLPDDEDADDDEDDKMRLDTDVVELMAAMDQELKGTAAGAKGSTNDGETVEEVEILTNLLNSLDAGAGGPGPVQSMMKAMGQEPPLLSPHDDLEPDQQDGSDAED